jgi:hypothetical protein
MIEDGWGEGIILILILIAILACRAVAWRRRVLEFTIRNLVARRRQRHAEWIDGLMDF